MATSSTPTADPRRPALRGRAFAFGLLFGVVAVALRASLQPLMGNELPFAIAFPATVVAAVLWGSGAGATTAIVCAIAIVSPQIAPDLLPEHRPLQLGAFLVGSIVISLFCGRLAARRAGESPVPPRVHRFETPLTTWLRAVLWGAMLIPATAFVIIAWWGFERAEREAEASVSHACELALRHAQRTLQVTAEIARRADQAAAGDDDEVRSREGEVHRRLADMTSGLPSVVNLNVWDAQGRPIARSDIFPVDPGANVSDRTYFQAQRHRAEPLGLSEVIIGRQSGRELFNATVRRAAPADRFTGVVSVSLAPSYFRDYYQSLATEQQAVESFTLVRLDGSEIARWPNGGGRVPEAPPSDLPILKRIAAGERAGTLTVPAGEGREARILSFRRLDGFPAFVVAGVGRDAMFASWIRFVALLAGVLLPTAAGLAYVSWVALKKTRLEAFTAAELQEQIRRRASAERSLLHTQRLETLAIVTGGVAHDFNNLLAIVTASLHVLQRRHPDLAREKHMEAMARAVRSGVRLTRQLLSFTRKQALRPETIQLQTWLPANEGLLLSTLGPSIDWRLSIADDTLAVVVDMGELELALINLVVNARHAMPNGGTLGLHVANGASVAAPASPRVVLAVRDDGVGIPPELLDKVMEPFFTTRAKGEGSGLGLSQVRGFCTEAGGALEIESTVGEGTTVRMFLPAELQAAPAPTPEPRATASLRGRVLLVEDNEDVGATTEMMLRSAGLDPVRHLNADAALHHLATTTELPDIVYSDISMPGSMNGIDFAFLLMRRHPGLPVLLTTGYTEQLDKAVAGGLRVLPKPVAPEDMLAELRVLLEKKGEAGAAVAPAWT